MAAVLVDRLASAQTPDVQLVHFSASEPLALTLEAPEVEPHLHLNAVLATQIAFAPLRDETAGAVVAWRADGELGLSLSLFERVELGVSLPVAWVRVNTDDRQVLGVSDVRLSAKFPLLSGEVGALGLRVNSTLPSGATTDFAGSGYWTLTPSLLGALHLGKVSLGLELGYILRKRVSVSLPQTEWDDDLLVSVGAKARLLPALSFFFESQLRIGVGGRSVSDCEVPMEVDAGARFHFGRVSLDVGAGTRVTQLGIGAPDFRAFAALRANLYRPDCSTGPEDWDGYQDNDQCAEIDDDADRIVDGVDTCPFDAEDRDGFRDGDGCPEHDDDGDGVEDARDACPRDAEDVDGVLDADGCPDRDNDEDGIPDAIDECSMEPEDMDGFEDDDGCPEPGPAVAVVSVSDSRILMSEKVYFDFDTDVIRSVSLPLLDQVASVIAPLPREFRVRVEGYTDGEGLDAYNLDLSFRRARSVVEYLVSKGIERVRLEYVGYGETRPIAPDTTAAGRALNRRVEFTIFE